MSEKYSVDDILEEIKRKKERQAVQDNSYSPRREESHTGGDFFEQRQTGTGQNRPQQAPAVPAYTQRYSSEPMTTRTIQVDDTLSQYFGPTEWKNGRKPKFMERSQETAPEEAPRPPRAPESADRAVQETNRFSPVAPKEEYIPPKEPVRRVRENPEDAVPRPEKGFERTAFVPEKEPAERPAKPAKAEVPAAPVGSAAPAAPSSPMAPDQIPVQEIPVPPAGKQAFQVNIPEDNFFEEPDVPTAADGPVTVSKNKELYNEYVEKRKNKVQEFMAQAKEPTEQDIPALKSPNKIKFSESSNSEVAREIMSTAASGEETEEAETETEDYCDPIQKDAVQRELSMERTVLLIRLMLTGLMLIFSSILSFAPMLGLTLPDPFSYTSGSVVFPSAELAVVCIAALICNNAVGSGIIGLLKFRATNDSFAASAVIGAVVLGVSMVIHPENILAGGMNLYFPIAILALFFNTVGKLFSSTRIIRNFKSLTEGEGKHALLPVHNRDLARELTGQTDEVPRFCCGAKTKFFTGFLELSYRDDATEGIAKTVAPIVFIAALIAAAGSFFFTGDIQTSINGFAAILCIASPLSAMIAGTMPVMRTCRELNKQGTMIAGGYTAETFAEADSVLLDIDELFPNGSIVLHGIKTFAQGRIDEAILDAASVICSTRSTLSGIFINVVQGDRSLLKPVDSIVYEDGMGLSAWVNSKRVLIGNRELMLNHGVDIPSHDYEEKYVGGGRDILYLSNSGELTAMFVLSYRADPEVARSLGLLAKRGIRLVVNCSDPNVTIEKITALYGYPADQIQLLSSKYQAKCSELTKEREKAPAAAVYDGSLRALSDLLASCGSIRATSFLAALLEIIGIVLGFVLVVFFLFTGHIDSLGVHWIAGYQLAWLIIVMLVTGLRKAI
ncbi:MAG TPA: hypothetical protein PKY19_05215 [Oscillospiraceae bacterium]|nr:hypothetical protein [Oscillospiraceae bacterium]